MTIERNDIKHLMWRKKVDSSIFNGESVIPMAFVKQWNLKSNFKDNGKNSSYWPVKIKFGSKSYDGKVFYRPPTKARSSEQHKIIFQEDGDNTMLSKGFGICVSFLAKGRRFFKRV